MKRRVFFPVLLMVLTVALAACGTKEKELFPLEELRNEDGGFQYKDIPFGSSSEEVLSQIPAEFEKMEAEDSLAVSYYTKETLEFYGSSASLWVNFDDDKLESVSVQIDLKDNEEAFQKILDELTGLYGEADEVRNGENDMFTSEIYLWGKDTDSSRLQADLIQTGSGLGANVAVFALE